MIQHLAVLRQGAAAVQAAYPKQAAQDLAEMLFELGK
jgi:hypothetical protein